MEIYITPGTSLAQGADEIGLKCSLFTDQVIHLRETLKTATWLVGSYCYYLSLAQRQARWALHAAHVRRRSLLPGRCSRGAWREVRGSFLGIGP